MSDCPGCSRTNSRRSILKAGLGGLCWVAFPDDVWGQGDPAAMPPQKDDVLVKLTDPAKPLTVADIPTTAEFVSGWPMSPASKVVRNGSRLNELLLVRLDPAVAGAKAADGVLAFSALCPHAGCNVTTWIPDKAILSCECHASDFDARAGGRVIEGAATRPLPPLPLQLNGDVLVIAQPFAGAIRFEE